MGFGVRPHWAFFLFCLEDQTAILQKVLQGLLLMTMIATAPIYYYIYYLLTMLSAEHTISFSFQNNQERQKFSHQVLF